MKTAVICIANNEDHYLQEWIDYHVKLGFSDVYVFQNNWRFKVEHDIPKNVHLVEFDGQLMMNPCYNGFIQKYHDKYDFVLFIDADEFLYVKNYPSLDEVLKKYENDDVVYINWRVFGDNGHQCIQNDEWSCIKRFTRCDDKLHRLGKNFLNFRKYGKRYSFYNPHIVLIDGKLVPYSDTSGIKETKIWDKFPDREQEMEIVHYQNKTWEEYYNRKYKKYDPLYGWTNRINTDLDWIKSEFINNNKNTIENTKIREFMYD